MSTRRRRRRRNARRSRNQLSLRAPIAQSSQIVNRGALRQLTVTHREFVRDIVVTTGGTPVVEQSEINPGIDEAFPWLSAIATRFESYQFNRLSFAYVPATGTTTQGSIALIPDYDAADDNSTATKAKLLTFEDSVRGPLWAPMTLNCQPRNLQKMKQRYVRHGPLADNLDIKTYDALSLTSCISFDTSSPPGNIGELWVEYSITFFTPQLEPEPPEISYLVTAENDGSMPFSGTTTVPNQLGVKKIDGNRLELTKPGDYLVNLATSLDEYTWIESIGDLTFTGSSGSWIETIKDLVSYSIGEYGGKTNTTVVHASNQVSDKNPIGINWSPSILGSSSGDPKWITTGLVQLTPDFSTILSKGERRRSLEKPVTIKGSKKPEPMKEESVELPMTVIRRMVKESQGGSA